MDIINKIAKDSFDRNIEYGFDDYKDVMSKIKREISNIDSQFDKVKFINIHLELVNEKYLEHLSECKNPQTCPTNFEYESISYFLKQELLKYGIDLSNDTFTIEEKRIKDDKLDKILQEIQELKLGNQIIYDDLLVEITELKELYFLGKKKWHQIFAGKFVDMAVSGVVSETVSKKIIESLKSDFVRLIN